MPASRQDSGWVKNAGDRLAGSFTEAIRDAVQDLGLTHGRIGYDDLRVGAKVTGSLADVFDAYDLMMLVRERKSAQEIEWLREATRVNQVAIERTVRFRLFYKQTEPGGLAYVAPMGRVLPGCIRYKQTEPLLAAASCSSLTARSATPRPRPGRTSASAGRACPRPRPGLVLGVEV